MTGPKRWLWKSSIVACSSSKSIFKIEGEIGYKPWYELALAIASKFDEGLRLPVPEVQPDGPKAPRWKGAHRRQLEAELSAIQKQIDEKPALVLAASV